MSVLKSHCIIEKVKISTVLRWIITFFSLRIFIYSQPLIFEMQQQDTLGYK